ncbi:MAG: mevalonate kinase [Anaerolineae bacterium]
MSAVVASAPGKLMLFGEHAVVYGHPCLVTAVNLRVSVQVAPNNSSRVTITTPTAAQPFIATVEELAAAAAVPDGVKFVALALKKFWEFTDTRFGVDIRTGSEFVNASGLGSSSAVTVATITALAAVSGANLAPTQLFQLSFDTVLAAQQGRASGFDVASAVYGGTIYYQNQGEEIRPVAVRHLPLMIIHSGVKASTTKLVGRVAHLQQEYPQHVARIFRGIAALVNDAVPLLEQGELEPLGQLMNFNQGYLNALGVSTGRLEGLVAGALKHGATGAKISGAGGGDCVIALAGPVAQTGIARFVRQNAGLSMISADIGAAGARIEQEQTEIK